MTLAKKDESTKDKILAAANRIFTKKGMAGARMQDIADEAGINKALLHYYFSNKQKLFEVVFEEAAEKLFSRISTVIESDQTLFDTIRNFTNEYISFITENPFLPQFVLSEMHQQQHKFIRHKFFSKKHFVSKLVNKIEAEVKKDNIKPISPVQLIMNMISMCIFPFIGKPVIQLMLQIDELQFRFIMEQRKTEVAEFIINSIRK